MVTEQNQFSRKLGTPRGASAAPSFGAAGTAQQWTDSCGPSGLIAPGSRMKRPRRVRTSGAPTGTWRPTWGDSNPRVHGHFDFKCVALAGVLRAGKVWPEYGFTPNFTVGIDKGFDAWVERAKVLAFANITTTEKEKVRRHAPSTVVPFVVSAGGGGVTEATNKMLPAPKRRNGLHN